MKGSLESLRNTWIKKRLLPLYQGKNPLMAAYDVKGVRFLAIDNSTYEINKKQLAFFNDHAKTGLPLILMVHIPMYAPGKNISFLDVEIQAGELHQTAIINLKDDPNGQKKGTARQHLIFIIRFSIHQIY